MIHVMLVGLTWLLGTSDAPPLWSSGHWSPELAWTLILSDVAIWAAYFTMPILLGIFTRKRDDVPFPKVFYLFMAFIFACGMTYLVDSTLFWWPAYRLSALVKVVTAIVSWITVIVLIQVIPKALALKSPQELKKEIEERKRAESELVSLNHELEERVAFRTKEAEERAKQVEQAYQQLKRQEEQLRTMFLDAADGIIGVDQEGIVRFVNPAATKMFGYTGQEMLNTHVTTFIPEAYHSHLFCFLDAPESDNAFQHAETGKQLAGLALHHNHSTFPIELSVNPMRYEGEQQLYTAFIRDVSAQMAYQEKIHSLNIQLEEQVRCLDWANRELEAFTYSASHDLQAPLRKTQLFIDMLREKEYNRLSDSGKDYIERISQNYLTMSQLITDLLSFSRASRFDIHRESLDLSHMAREILAHLKETEPDRQVTIDIVPGMHAVGDPRLINVVLTNLLSNAWKYTQNTDNPRISVTQAEKDGQPCYIVQDNGIGFDESETDKLFLPFSRLSNSVGFEGNGVGLATVQRIIIRHNGEIWAHSTPNTKTAFYFTLPAIHHTTEGQD